MGRQQRRWVQRNAKRAQSKDRNNAWRNYISLATESVDNFLASGEKLYIEKEKAIEAVAKSMAEGMYQFWDQTMKRKQFLANVSTSRNGS